jgi:HAD superfamily hydrolase (TIGR01509 family)
MRNKLVIFDLDGVMIDSRELHYDALNEALRKVGEEFVITREEHLSTYDGLKTQQKLEMLSRDKNLPIKDHSRVWEGKQKYTLEALKLLPPDENLIHCMSKLNEDGFKLAVCSNSIRKTVLTVLAKIGIIEFIDLILSNEDVKNAKPHPEMYWKAISMMNCLPEETLIVEDSPYGLLAASRSNSHILRVKNPKEVSYESVKDRVESVKTEDSKIKTKWKDSKLNILIPMAGAGSRFEKAGYTCPKPLVEVNKKPMIQLVVENLNIDANYIFVVQKTHREKYNLDTMLNLIAPNCKIVEVDGVTEGAACTTLLAKEYIDNNSPLFFANSDQYVDWDSNEFMYKMNETQADGGMVTFTSTHPKWSFAKVDENGIVTEVAEKNPISDIATIGFYYWKHGSDYVKYAEEMIEKNIRVNNEFYVCPVFNQAIADGKKIRTFQAKAMWGLGTPEDLDYYLKSRQ